MDSCRSNDGQSIEMFQDKLRLQTLKEVMMSPKTTKPFTEVELRMFSDSFLQNVRMQTVSHRIEFVHIVLRTLQRLKGSYSFLLRKNSLNGLEEIYEKFLEQLVRTCFSIIYPTAYFGQKTACLQILKYCVTLYMEPKYILGMREHFCKAEKLVYNSLLIALSDTFEDNKKEALDLLILLNKHKIFTTINMNDLEETSRALSVSLNPPDSLTSRYLLRLMVGLSGTDMNEKAFTEMHKLVLKLESAVLDTQTSIINGAAHNPIHTRLASLRGLVFEIDLKKISNSPERWNPLFGKVIELCLKSCKLVETIVCNDSPEGHLPMDCEPVSEDFLKTLTLTSRGNNVREEKRIGITTQMLLIFGWKTIREAAHLLADIFRLQPSIQHSDDEPGLVTCEQLVIVLRFFEYALLEIKHRGAFEQAYFAFCNFIPCIKKLKCDHAVSADNVLLEVLHGLEASKVSDVHRETQVKMIFRRSAGLPLIVQAILGGHVTINIAGDIYHHSVKTLLRTVSNEQAEDWQIIHCLNILRGICRDTKLGPHIEIYWEHIFKLCICSFVSTNYCIRNSSSLLFSAMMRRVFGQQQKDSSKTTTMSTRQFFVKFPSLYDYLIKVIKHCLSSDLSNPNTSSPLYLVLLMMNRLYCSLKERDVVDLSVFSPLFRDVAERCPHYRVRHLAARAYVQLGNHEEFVRFFNDISGDFSFVLSNKSHGKLLIVDNMLKLLDNEKLTLCCEKIQTFILNNLVSSMPEEYSHLSCPNLNIFVNICHESITKKLIDEKTESEIISVISQLSFKVAQISDALDFGIHSEELLVNLLVFLIAHDCNSRHTSVTRVLQLPDKNRNLKIALFGLTKLSTNFGIDDQFCYDFPFRTLNVANLDTESLIDSIVSQKIVEKAIRQGSDMDISNNHGLLAASSKLSLISTSDALELLPEIVNYTIKYYDCVSEETKACLIVVSSKLAKSIMSQAAEHNSAQTTYNVIQALLSLASEELSAQSDLIYRQALANFILDVLPLSFDYNKQLIAIDNKYALNNVISKISGCLLALLEDDDVDVRQTSSLSVTTLLSLDRTLVANRAMESFLAFYLSYYLEINEVEHALMTLTDLLFTDHDIVQDDDQDDRLFDKTKLNMFEDIVIRNQLILKTMQNIPCLKMINFSDECWESLTNIVSSSKQKSTTKQLFLKNLILLSKNWLSKLLEQASLKNVCLMSTHCYVEASLASKLNFVTFMIDVYRNDFDQNAIEELSKLAETIVNSDAVLSPYAYASVIKLT